MTVILAAAAAAALAQAASPPPPLADVEARVLAATNDFRRQNGLPPVSVDSALTSEARAFAAYLANSQAFSHTADGRTPAQRAEAAGYRFCVLGENIAYEAGSPAVQAGQLSRLFVAGWESSPGHRRNMLNPEVVETGVAVARARAADKYVAVQVFGRPIALQLRFSIANRSPRPVAYRIGPRRRRIVPGETVDYTSCDAGELEFEGQVKGPSRFAPEPAAYVLTAEGAGYRVEIERPRGPLSGEH